MRHQPEWPPGSSASCCQSRHQLHHGMDKAIRGGGFKKKCLEGEKKKPDDSTPGTHTTTNVRKSFSKNKVSLEEKHLHIVNQRFR